MEWENKFSSIVRETESNLARVRDRLGASVKTKPFSRSSVNFYGGSTGSPGLGSVHSPADIRSQVIRSPKKSDIMWDVDSSGYRLAKTVGMTSGAPCSQVSPALVNALFERIEQQAELVSQLSVAVVGLEKERSTQAGEIKRMKDEISRLGERLRERGVDLETERKLEQFKHDIYSQLEFVQSQVRLKQSGSENILSDTAFTTETRRIVQDETEVMQRELEHLKTRLGKTEIALHSALGDSRDILRKQDRLDRVLSSLSEHQRSQSRSLNSVSDERQSDSHELRQLKHMVDRMSQQYSELESELRSSIRHSTSTSQSSSARQPPANSSKKFGITNGRTKSRRKVSKQSKRKAASDDLLLSSSDSDQLNLTELDLSSASESDLASIALDRTHTGVNGVEIANLSSTSLSSLDSDDLLGDLQ